MPRAKKPKFHAGTATIIGLPNAGKSTLLSRLSHARPKIADYPFTTLHPQLGVVRIDDESEFVLADLPGLIEGASDGAGLGTRFLGHVERCAVVLHLIDGTEEDVVGAYRTIRRELADYGHGIAAKPEVIGLNKIDAIDPAAVEKKRRALVRAARSGTPVLPLSGVSGAGLPAVLGALLEAIRDSRANAETRALVDVE
jgi:GTP-binding protein